MKPKIFISWAKNGALTVMFKKHFLKAIDNHFRNTITFQEFRVIIFH